MHRTNKKYITTTDYEVANVLTISNDDI